MDSFEFSEEEIRNELARFGIKDIDQSTLREFREDLLNLMKESSYNSLQNVAKSTTISPSSSNSPVTCPNLSPSSPPEPFSITSPTFTSPAAKNVEDAKSCLTHTGNYCSVNSMDPSSVTVSHNRPQNTAESSEHVAYRSSQLFNSANKVDGHSEMTLSHQYTHTQQPLTNRSETEHEKQENLLRTFTRKNIPQVNSFDNPKNKENAWSRHIAPSSSSSSLSSQESVPKPSQIASIDTEKPPLLNTYVTKRKVSRKGPDGKRYIDEITPTPPRLKKNRKTDPVSRFREFQNYWNLHKPPGENNHNALRWSIKEKIAKHDVIGSRPRKTFVPNNYVIPSQNPRHSLRWQIRTDLAYGVMPTVASYDY
ncbi:centriolar and ciliogenesis-associated protein HYLS1-like [Octopus bimaculoides]|uniref:centriolar and ciliogenesis-associated protein HYLS1-like n=1 Tax=Octopus bimaculoides TaxID=37653 RepID=UPI0022E2ECDD|nr:centriolar and ciliogenesis-associated protein HYLS1-like [Octopus bimaculoides]